MNYEELTVEQLNAVNDDLGRQIEAIREERYKLKDVRARKLRETQVLARYKGKVKAEDVPILRALGALPKDEGTVLTPGIALATASGVSV
jgi:hypothetical protein